MKAYQFSPRVPGNVLSAAELSLMCIIVCTNIMYISGSKLDFPSTFNGSTLANVGDKAEVSVRGPAITHIIAVSQTVLKVQWKKLTTDNDNKKIIKYRICYQIRSTFPPDCSFHETINGPDTTMAILTGLNKDTTYDIAIKAGTDAGFGRLGETKSERTLGDYHPSHYGKHFILGFTQQFSRKLRKAYMTISIVAMFDTNITITVPALSNLVETLSIQAGNFAEYNLPISLRMNGTFKERKGIEVNSTEDIALICFSQEDKSISDGYLALPSHALGTYYISPPIDLLDKSLAELSTIGVVSGNDGTTVTINFREKVALEYNGTFGEYSSMSVTLGKMETFHILHSVKLTRWTEITANKPITVISGTIAASSNTPVSLVTMLLPFKNWGSTFIVVPTKSYKYQGPWSATVERRSDLGPTKKIWRYEADNTAVVHLCTIGDGPWCEIVQRNNVGDMNFFIVALPSIAQYLSYYRLVLPKRSGYAHSITLSIKASCRNGLIMNGLPMTGLQWRNVSKSRDYVWTIIRMSASDGIVTVFHSSTAVTFGLLVVGWKEGTTDAYGYPGGYSFTKSHIEPVCSPALSTAVPAKGPNITYIIAVNQTAIKVQWAKLTTDAAKAEIIKYRICYQIQSSSQLDCSFQKTVIGTDSTMVILTSLSKDTTYDIGIKAATIVGYGPLGETRSGRTLRDFPARGPNITQIIPVNQTALKVQWSALTASNGDAGISKYKMCYQIQSIFPLNCFFHKTVNGANTTMAILTGLNKDTTYDVAIKAGTFAGFGRLGGTRSGRTLGDLQARGPNITQIFAVNQTALKVQWNKLTSDNAKADIIKYRICYQIRSTFPPDCSFHVTVNDSDTTMVILTDLNKDTTYDIAIKAGTAAGFGRLGEKRSGRTSGDPSCSSEKVETDWGVFSWPETEVGKLVTLPCPHDAKVKATRKCQLNVIGGEISWTSTDARLCPYNRSLQMLDLSKKPVNPSNVMARSEKMRSLTSSGEDLTAEDIANTVSVLEKVVLVKTYADQFADSILKTIDNILDASLEAITKSQEETNSSNRILQLLNDLLEEINVTEQMSFKRTFNNFAIDVSTVKPRTLTGVTFSGIFTGNTSNRSEKPSIIKNLSSERIAADLKATSLHLPQALFSDTSPGKSLKFQTVIVALYKETKFFHVPNSNKSQVNSFVISGSIKGRSVENLKAPVVLTYVSLKHAVEDKALCAFWNFSQANWAYEGCTFQGVLEDGRVVCHCDHLTNFAMLIDNTAMSKETPHDEVLGIISYIGCGLSLIGLVLTIITILLFKDLRKKVPLQILLNFCIALSLTLVVFLTAAERSKTTSMASCRAAAIALHYFVLVAFMWMAIEAFNMYLMFVIVMPSHFSRFILKCCVVSWGVPAVIVSVTMAVALDEYGDTRYCRLNGLPFLAAFLTPIVIILLGNTIIFIVIFRSLLVAGSKVTSDQKKKGFRRARQGAAILVLLGLTWSFGVFAIRDAKIVFQYLFCIFNSLQGFFVFIFYCVLSSSARKKYKNVLGDSSKNSSSLNKVNKRVDSTQNNFLEAATELHPLTGSSCSTPARQPELENLATTKKSKLLA